MRHTLGGACVSICVAQQSTLMNWQDLAIAVGARRNALGLSKRQAIAAAGVSSNTWLKLENDAEPISQHLWRKVEVALDWEHGSIEAVLEGGAPTVSPTLDERVERLVKSDIRRADLVDELLRRVERLEGRVRELEG